MVVQPEEESCENSCSRRFCSPQRRRWRQYPQRPMQLIVPWGAGGGTDATARIIGALARKDLKQPINVVNRTGG